MCSRPICDSRPLRHTKSLRVACSCLGLLGTGPGSLRRNNSIDSDPRYECKETLGVKMQERLLRELLVESCDRSRYYILKFRVHIDGSRESHHIAAEMALNGAYGTLSNLPWHDKRRTPLVLDVSEVGDKYRVEIAVPVEISQGKLNLPQLLTLAWLASEYRDT